MNVEHLYTTSDKIDQLPVKNGRIIVLTDKPAAYYDIGGKRFLIGSDSKPVLDNYFKFQGKVTTVDDLPNSDLKTGWVYNVEESDMNYVWTGEKWYVLSETIDLSGYAEKTYVDKVTPKQLTDLNNDFGELMLTTVSKQGVIKNYKIFAREV